MVKLKDVFVAGGMPSITYVDREQLHLERSLKSQLDEGYKIVAITGPTKSGKTVLCRRVIDQEDCVWIDGGQIEKSDDFWSSLVNLLELPSEETIQEGSSTGIGIKTLLTLKADMSAGRTIKFQGPAKKRVLRYMRESDITLIVDDFHYLSEAVQQDVVRSLKSEIFDGLSAVLIAVPHRAFDAIAAEPEMEGRYAHVAIPYWNKEDLQKIAASGFPKLGMEVDSATTKDFSDEATGSPLLMQRFCGRLCQHYEVRETVKPRKEFKPTRRVRTDIYRSVAQQFGFPTFEKLARGPQSRSKRNPRKLRTQNGHLDIYQALLAAVGATGPKAKLHYNEIRDALKELLVDSDVPAKHEVSSTLGHMETIARTKLKGEPVLEWSKDYLYLTDPFLMFYMR